MTTLTLNIEGEEPTTIRYNAMAHAVALWFAELETIQPTDNFYNRLFFEVKAAIVECCDLLNNHNRHRFGGKPTSVHIQRERGSPLSKAAQETATDISELPKGICVTINLKEGTVTGVLPGISEEQLFPKPSD